MRRRRSQKKPESIEIPKARANEEIDAETVRIVDPTGSNHQVVSIQEAMKLAQERELDLVEISAKADIPICRIMDLSKFVFEAKKKKMQLRKNQKQSDQKTIKFRPNISDGDYHIKLRKITDFLNDGARIKIVLWFRGREIAHQELGMEMMNRIKDELKDQCRIDEEPKLEGRQMVMSIFPIAPKKI